MKKILSLFGALMIFTGLKAQTTSVKKETTQQKSVPTVNNNDSAKALKLTDTESQKINKNTKAVKLTNPNLQKGGAGTMHFKGTSTPFKK
ncbi:MAG: hypothetical protein IT214_01395 [Chitinophagaceae bacterium]|nr:hypothetical protein [Chitinophagaceae bacterium]